MDTVETIQQLFGSQVRAYRIQHAWTLKVLAAQLGMTETSLSRVERGKQNLSLKDIALIAELLNVPVPILFGGTLTPLPPPTLEMLAAQAQTLYIKAQGIVEDTATMAATARALIGDRQNQSPNPEEKVPSSGLEYLGSEQYDPASSYEEDDVESVYAYATAV